MDRDKKYLVEVILSFVLLILTSVVPRTQSVDMYIPGLSSKKYEKTGDFMIGVLIPVHQRSVKSFCHEEVRDFGLLQRLEALAFTIEQVNNNNTLLADYTLGYVMFDDCYKDQTALAHSLHFARTQQQNVPYLSYDESMEIIDVVGVIGSESSVTTVQAANMLSSFQIPQVSYLSTSPLLSDRIRYPHFWRTLPSDNMQVRMIVQMLTHYDWQYVSVVYSEGEYGFEAYQALERKSEHNGICFAAVREIRRYFTTTDYKNVVSTLLQESHSRVVVVFLPSDEAMRLLDAARDLQVDGRLTWIASDAWARDSNDFTGYEHEMNGGFSINIQSNNVVEFDEYFAGLKATSSNLNPWMDDFLSQYFNCSSATSQPGLCGPNIKLTDHPLYIPDITVALVYDAVNAYAYALDAIVQSVCRGYNTSTMTRCALDNLPKFLSNVSFESAITGQAVSFNRLGDRSLPYYLYNIQNQSDGSHEMVLIGVFDPIIQQLGFFNQTITWSNGTKPDARCSHPCKFGERQLIQQKSCCWSCEKCEDNYKSYNDTNGRQRCMNCPENTWPNEENMTYCVNMTARYIGWDEPMGIALACVATLGIAMSITTCVWFILHRTHALIRASSKELSYFMLFGVVTSFGFVCSFLFKPAAETCFASMFGFAICFTLIYAPLMTKAIRIYRIFESGRKSAKKPQCVCMKSQLLISLGITAVHMTIVMTWAVFEPPTSDKVMANPGQQDILCVFPTGPFVTSVVFNLVLLVICSVLAFLNRKLPDNFNESKFIIISVYSTAALWLAFIPAYFLTMSIYRILFLSLVLLINGFVILGGLFIPKVYAVYFLKTGDMHVHDWRRTHSIKDGEINDNIPEEEPQKVKSRNKKNDVKPL